MDSSTVKERLPSIPIKRLLGRPISLLSMEQTVEQLRNLLKAGVPSQIVTADSVGLVISQEDDELRQIYESAALVTADSSGVVWGLSRLGERVERVSGVDLVDRLCALSAQHGYKIFFLGSAPGVADLAAERLTLKHPGCNIVGTRHGFFPEGDSDVVAQEIAAYSPDIVLVAMGIPRQEKFIFNRLQSLGAAVCMGVGGSLDVYSGRVKRAPNIVQRIRMEWLWRLVQNPRKLEKVARLPRFVWLVLRGKQ